MLQPWRLAPDLTDTDAQAAARIWATQWELRRELLDPASAASN